MMKDTSVDMSHLLEVRPSYDDLAIDHALDVSASVYRRLKELGMTQNDLAEKLGVDKSWVSRIMHGYPGMSLKTLAKLELALDMDLSSGFVYRPCECDADPESGNRSGFELVEPCETGVEQAGDAQLPQGGRFGFVLAVE